MTPQRLKQIMRAAKSASPSKLQDLFFEIYGATSGMKNDRTRESILEACQELLDARKKPKGGEA